ncbi:hypothetical protein JCM10213_009083 [Rhodosporidiobolus nylandii]
MPVPSLPYELIEPILSQLTLPLTKERPAFYDDLRSASLVCKTWAEIAQELLCKAVYLDSEEKARRFLAVEEKASMTKLALHDEASTGTDMEAWDSDLFLEIAERCRSVERFVCTLSFEEVCEIVPAFLSQFFPNLRHLELIRHYRLPGPQPLPPLLASITVVPVSRFAIMPADAATLVARDCDRGLLPRLTAFSIQSSNDLPMAGGALSRQLRRCHIKDASGYSSCILGCQPPFRHDIRVSLPKCTSLQHLSIDLLRGPEFSIAFPESLITLVVAKVDLGVAAGFLAALPSALPRLSNLTLLRVGNWSEIVEQSQAEHAKAVEQACEAQGVELVKV